MKKTLIEIRTDSKTLLISIAEIFSIESENNRAKITLKDGTILLDIFSYDELRTALLDDIAVPIAQITEVEV